MEETTKIAIFKGKKVRRTIYQNEWYFSVVDIIEALTDSNKPRDYWYRMKEREKKVPQKLYFYLNFSHSLREMPTSLIIFLSNPTPTFSPTCTGTVVFLPSVCSSRT